jgi:hypothetical protein
VFEHLGSGGVRRIEQHLAAVRDWRVRG